MLFLYLDVLFEIETTVDVTEDSCAGVWEPPFLDLNSDYYESDNGSSVALLDD